MTEIIIYAVLGLGGLLAGGAMLIPGVVGLARQMGLPAVAVAVIVIAGGTSAPELIVSVDATLEGSPGIVWGNLIGSNIANIALVLGLGMLVRPVVADAASQRQLIGLTIVTMLVWGICLTGGLIQPSGYKVSGGLLLGFAAYLVWLLHQPDSHSLGLHMSGGQQPVMLEERPSKKMSSARAAVYAAGGVICLVAGADSFVWSGAELARSYGWSEDVIGLTIIAVGTSLPEITSVLASMKYKRHDIALSSVVGSNLLNFTLVLGAAGLTGPLPTSDLTGEFMMPVLLALTTILVICATLNQPLGRRSGLVFVGFYLTFLSLNLNMFNT